MSDVKGGLVEVLVEFLGPWSPEDARPDSITIATMNPSIPTLALVRGTAWEGVVPTGDGFIVGVFPAVSDDMGEIAEVVSSAPGNRLVLGIKRGLSPSVGAVCWTEEPADDLLPTVLGPSGKVFSGPRLEVAERVKRAALADHVMSS